MAYSELIKDFNRIRDYMREFYVYGFKTRKEFTTKSARSYDNERRRVESWLGDYMDSKQAADGRNAFISIDSRTCSRNPLYQAWKAKSFTDGAIMLHFYLLDILATEDEELSLQQIIGGLEHYGNAFAEPALFDESTVRKKLKEYVGEGLLVCRKQGRESFYRRAEDVTLPAAEALALAAEIAPCGVIGSFILDKLDEQDNKLAFKHHYITAAMDSEILLTLLQAISERRSVLLKLHNKRKVKQAELAVVPLKIFASVQNGRQYVLAYTPTYNRIASYRLDNIVSIKVGSICDDFAVYAECLRSLQPHMWGVSMHSSPMHGWEHVEFTVTYGEHEQYIHQRLVREKRCGVVEKLDAAHSKFSADVCDAMELVPWIRTFLCRITDINFSDKNIERQFRKDLQDMYALYGLAEEEQA